jgi:S-adenosylmethionine:tRNA ribosyltransferase-isomerase
VDVNQFDYHLPQERIAQTPVEPRSASRLMVINRQTGQISHHPFTAIVELLQAGDILIANDSRVIPARLFGHKRSGGKVEILLLKQRDDLRWEALVGGKRLRPGIIVEIEAGGQGSPSTSLRTGKGDPFQPSNLPTLQPSNLHTKRPIILTIREDLGEARRLIEFSQPINARLDEVGHVPLPPYIHETLADAERYQTIFSRRDGSAAAPTAGLHFTPEILLALREKEVAFDTVTLHIGLDTFKPVAVEHVEAHPIHREWARLNPETAHRLNQTKLAGGRLVAVGTTVMRTLESAALRSAGVTGSLRQASQIPPPFLGIEGRCPWKPVVALEEETDLFIYPGFTFRAVDALLTNFHLPKSSLLMLVSAFAGLELIREAYALAIAEEYRFFSFGDAMLIV